MQPDVSQPKPQSARTEQKSLNCSKYPLTDDMKSTSPANLFRSVLASIALGPSYLLLTASDDRLAEVPPREFSRAWIGLMVISGLWGIASAFLWELSLWVFDWYWGGIPLIPAGVVLAGGALWLYRRSILSLAQFVSGTSGPTGRSLSAAVIVAFLALVLLGLKGWNEDWAPYPWWLIRPRAMYRALILAPVWGAWSMLITSQLCKPSDRTGAPVAAFAAGCGPLVAAVCLALLLVATISYFNYLPWTQLTICAAGAIGGVLIGCALCRRAGGLVRSALLGGNIATQIAFLLGYLANR